MIGLRATALAVVVLSTAGCTPDGAPTTAPSASGSAPVFAPGAAGIGDPYFPANGNGGYDVASYDLKLRYDPATDALTGTATVAATATADLSRFDLDLAHLTASAVTVDGAPAQHRADAAELVITPAAGIPAGRPFTVVVDYAGVPKPVGDKILGEGGFLTTKDGGFALGQPESAASWFPVNDHPSDKATFSVAVTVPQGLEALSNGIPGDPATAAGWTTWTWAESEPMASYLAFLVIGRYRVTTTSHKGKPMIIAIPDSLPANGTAAESLAGTAEIADYLETLFGSYPFTSYGGIVLDDDRVRYALETQTRPVYGVTFFSREADLGVVAHELAHQWFGDSVSISRWKDMWLNEGFATYAEWLWAAHEGEQSVQASFDETYAGFDWATPSSDPGLKGLFGPPVYQRGAMIVHALRRTIGDEDFFRLLTTWTAERRGGNASTEDFVAVAERVSGESLTAFADAWIFGTKQPPKP
jgi:aminopeptidase N